MIDLALRATRTREGFTGNFESWDEAARQCSGYESPEVVELYKAAAKERQDGRGGTQSTRAYMYDSRSLRLVAAFQTFQRISETAPGGALRILDYGGASGAHYDLARTVPALSIDKYTIVESPAVARALHPFSSGTLEWVSSAQSSLPEAVGPIDLILSSSTIQYVSNPIGLLAEFAAVSQFLILDRIPLIARDAHTVMKQHTRYNGRAVTYPTWVFSEQAFLSELAELGYEIILQWEVPEDRPLLDGRRRPNVGMLLQRCTLTTVCRI